MSNKNQSGSISGSEFNLSIGVAQQQYFRKKLGLTEEYTVQDRQAREEIQSTQSIMDSLRPFMTLAVISRNGVGFDWPADYAAYLPSNYLYVYQENGQTVATRESVDFVSQSEFNNRLNNYVTPPSLTYPLATYGTGQIEVKPDAITQIKLAYYRYPVKPVFNFTVNANDEIVYVSAGSVDLEFPNLDWENIAHMAVKYWATFLRDEALYQIEDKRQSTGQ